MTSWIVEIRKVIGVHGDVTTPRQAIIRALNTYQGDPEFEDVKWSRLEVTAYPDPGDDDD